MAEMKKRRMSAAARKRISLAQKRRWRAFRAGRVGTTAKMGRPAKSASLNSNPYLNMSIERLVSEKRQLDEAWKVARSMLR
ncbi:MAG: hypothetical protein O7D94_11870 [Planctomycetota bacterium]|nr:hypothetical protein [Planctomycetota bacterium]MCZ6699620.1 hypothetical protein [Planctomycetota bacterium]